MCPVRNWKILLAVSLWMSGLLSRVLISSMNLCEGKEESMHFIFPYMGDAFHALTHLFLICLFDCCCAADLLAFIGFLSSIPVGTRDLQVFDLQVQVPVDRYFDRSRYEFWNPNYLQVRSRYTCRCTCEQPYLWIKHCQELLKQLKNNSCIGTCQASPISTTTQQTQSSCGTVTVTSGSFKYIQIKTPLSKESLKAKTSDTLNDFAWIIAKYNYPFKKSV